MNREKTKFEMIKRIVKYRHITEDDKAWKHDLIEWLKACEEYNEST